MEREPSAVERTIQEVDEAVAHTSLKLRDPELFAAYRAANQPPYTAESVDFAERWGKYMQSWYRNSDDGMWSLPYSFANASLPRKVTIDDMFKSPALRLLLETMDLGQGLHGKVHYEALDGVAAPEMSTRPFTVVLKIADASLKVMAAKAVAARSGLSASESVGMEYGNRTIPVQKDDTPSTLVASYGRHLQRESEFVTERLVHLLGDRAFVEKQFPNPTWEPRFA